METELLKNNLESIVRSDKSFLDAREILVHFKNEGGSKSEAESVLYEMLYFYRTIEINEEREDKVLEIMDIVHGFCRIDLTVW
jgi:hypothetical protein